MLARRLGFGGLVLGLILGSSVVMTAQDKSETKETFKKFSPDGKFEIMMPADPKDASQNVEGLKVKIWAAESGKSGAYLVSSTELPANPGEKEIDEVLKQSAQGQIKGMGGKEKKTTAIKLDKYKGLEVEAEIPARMGVSLSRVYIADGHLYQLIVIGEKEFVESKEAKKFMDSFKLTGKEK